MSETFRYSVASANLLIGIASFLLQFCSTVMYGLPMDLTSSGMWGGMIILATGIFLIKKERVMTMVFALLSVLSGFAMMAYYSWSLSNYSDLAYKCSGLQYAGHGMCSRVIIDSFFIIFGILSICINAILVHKTDSIPPKQVPFEAHSTTALSQTTLQSA